MSLYNNNNNKSSYYQRFCDYMQNDTLGVEIGIYTVSGLIFAVAYHRIRPITKFGKASDIPQHFISNKLIQQGTVQSIEPNINSGTLLRIKHRPLVNILFASKKTLPVKIAGVDINSNGFSWLQNVATNNKVTFLPIVKHENYAECKVFLLQENSKLSRLDLAEALLQLGFARISQEIPIIIKNDKQLIKYYKKLSIIQKDAKKSRQGLWSAEVPPPRWPITKLNNLFKTLLLQIIPEKNRLPVLVR